MRRLYWLVGIGALLLLIADVAYWQLAVWQLRRGLDLWQANARAAGWVVDSGAIAAAGWPLTAALTVPNVTLRHGRGTMPGAVDLAAPVISVSVPLLQPTQLRVRISSPMHMMWDGLPDMILAARSMAITTPLRRNPPGPVAFRAEDLRLDPASGIWHATAGVLTLDAVPNPVKTGGSGPPSVADFVVDAQTVTLPSTVKWALGPGIGNGHVQASLHGAVPTDSAVTQAADAWRKDGGFLDVGHYAVHWGPLDLSGSATLTLDGQLQPAGTGTAHIVGYADTLDRLAAAGVMTRSAAAAAKAILSLIGSAGEEGQPSAIDVPLRLQYRTLSIRQIPLLTVPELDWPAAQ